MFKVYISKGIFIYKRCRQLFTHLIIFHMSTHIHMHILQLSQINVFSLQIMTIFNNSKNFSLHHCSYNRDRSHLYNVGLEQGRKKTLHVLESNLNYQFWQRSCWSGKFPPSFRTTVRWGGWVNRSVRSFHGWSRLFVRRWCSRVWFGLLYRCRLHDRISLSRRLLSSKAGVRTNSWQWAWQLCTNNDVYIHSQLLLISTNIILLSVCQYPPLRCIQMERLQWGLGSQVMAATLQTIPAWSILLKGWDCNGWWQHPHVKTCTIHEDS